MTSLLLQPCANPRILVCEVQGGDDVYRVNGLILTCAAGATHIPTANSAEAESEQVCWADLG